MTNILESFKKNAVSLGLDSVMSRADVIVVAFSGGADSSALLHLLRRFYANAEIRAIHVNHMIRGADADRDEAHCRAVCDDLNIKLRVKKEDVPAYARGLGIGVEEAARNVRYSAFAKYLEELSREGLNAFVATAHNADDNLETILFNLARGSATRGIGGIAPLRGRFVRPVLCYTSAEIRKFCAEENITYVLDGSNEDTGYTRNLIRKEILPQMRRINPSCAKNALTTSALIRRDDDFLFRLTKGALAEDGDLEIMRSLDDSVLSRVILGMYSDARGSRKDFGSVHIESCIDLIRRSERGEISLPGQFVMRICGGRVCFERKKTNAEEASIDQTLISSAESIRGKVAYFPFEDAGFCLCLSDSSLPMPENPSNGENIYKISIHTTLRFDTIRGSIFIRSRQGGDTLRMGGMTRRLKKLFNAAKTENRELVPVICDDDGILYVPGIGCRDGSIGESGIRISYWR